MSPEELQSKHQLLADAAAFMIENADKVFDLPDRNAVLVDLQDFRNILRYVIQGLNNTIDYKLICNPIFYLQKKLM